MLMLRRCHSPAGEEDRPCGAPAAAFLQLPHYTITVRWLTAKKATEPASLLPLDSLPQLGMEAVQGAPGAGPVVLVSACKGEARSLRAGYKSLARRLKAARCDVRRLEGAGLTAAALQGATILVFGGPTQPFTPAELDCLRAYLRRGGSMLVLGSARGEGAGAPGSSGSSSSVGQEAAGYARAGPGSNINCLLEEYGMSLGSDCVIQTAFTKWACPPSSLLVGSCSHILLMRTAQRAGRAGRPEQNQHRRYLQPNVSFASPAGTPTPSKCW